MKSQLSKGLTAVGISAVLVVGVGGFAYGATGGSFLLGKSNTAGASTSLTNTGSDVTLKLFTKSSLTAPFSTNAQGKVVNLYADKADTANTANDATKLGGKTLSQVIASAQPATLTCAQGGNCVVGDTGPGNGKVFYDAGSMKSWGRYLEAAPNTWSGGSSDSTFAWCSAVSDVPGGALGTAIGTGWANTERTARYCDSGAAVATRGYHGGGKADWFLPSIDELNQLCRWAWNLDVASTSTCGSGVLSTGIPPVGGFSTNHYWSSSQDSPNVQYSWNIVFFDGVRYYNGDGYKSYVYSVRPIRAF